MQAKREITILRLLFLLMPLLSSCSQPQGQVDITDPSESAEQQNNPMAKRFQKSAPQGRTVVESAIELSQKYAILSEEAVNLQKKNDAIIAENRQLKEQISVLDAKLKQTQKELAEANDLLMEMRIELNNWKTVIVGFRDEMREAETAQLEALLKILKILSGESTSETIDSKNENSVMQTTGSD
jgi:signal transduction histidine kinase